MAFSISKLPVRVQIAIYAAVILGLCGVFYAYMIVPLRTELESLEGRIQTLGAEIAAGRIVQARLPEIKQKVALQEETLSRLREILPEEKETAEIIRRVQEVAVQSNLRIRSFSPQRTVRKEFYEDWPILIALEGNYDNLGRFFEEVGQFTRIVNVDNINIRSLPEQTPERTLTATCTATTFVFLEAAPEPPPPTPAPRRRGRGSQG